MENKNCHSPKNRFGVKVRVKTKISLPYVPTKVKIKVKIKVYSPRLHPEYMQNHENYATMHLFKENVSLSTQSTWGLTPHFQSGSQHSESE